MDNIYYSNLINALSGSKKKSVKEIDTHESIVTNKSINYQKRRKKALLILAIVFLLGIFNFFFISKSNVSTVSDSYTEKEYLQADYVLKNYLNKSVVIYKNTGDFRELKFPKNVKVIATKNNIVISSMINNKCWSISNFEKNTQVSLDLSRLKC
jgi:hypothetical protein